MNECKPRIYDLFIEKPFIYGETARERTSEVKWDEMARYLRCWGEYAQVTFVDFS